MVASVASAANPQAFNLPIARPKKGLFVTFDFTWVDSEGNRPVRVEFRTSNGLPLTADRRLLVQVVSIGAYSYGRTARVEKYVELPEGSRSTVDYITVPQSQPLMYFTLLVWEDGQLLRELSIEDYLAAGGRQDWSTVGPAALFIDSDAVSPADRVGVANGTRSNAPIGAGTKLLPDVREFLVRSSYSGSPIMSGAYVASSGSTNDKETCTLLASAPNVELLPPSHLPPNWIDYTSLDMVFISLADLRGLKQTHPDRVESLRRWTETGPTFCVYGVGDDPAAVDEVSRLLGIVDPPAPRDPNHADAGPWKAPDPNRHGKDSKDLPRHQQARDRRYGQVIASTVEMESPDRGAGTNKTPPRLPARPPFKWRECQLGRVVAFASSDPFAPGEELQWDWFFATVGYRHWNWNERHGFSQMSPSNEYWEFLIAGTGLAPASTFLVLISVFVLVIGPVSYLVLYRARRLYLLLVTVPAGAGVVVAALFAYALASDGLSTQARIRDFTLLDQSAGRQVVWSRQSYYAGLAPSRGLSFPGDAAVYPISPSSDMHAYGFQSRVLAWEDGRQVLRSGYIQSRTTAQFVVIRPAATEAKLRIVQQASGERPMQLKNELGAPIRVLLACDAQGRYQWASGVAAGATFAPQADLPKPWKSELFDLQQATAPRLPDGFDEEALHQYGAYRRGYYYYSQMNGNMYSLRNSVLEQRLGDAFQAARTEKMEPGTYLAVLEHVTAAPLGTTYVREKESLHVVLGKW
jgi:hypothetical protein